MQEEEKRMNEDILMLKEISELVSCCAMTELLARSMRAMRLNFWIFFIIVVF